MSRYKRHLFVCTNERPAGHPKGCCSARGSGLARDRVKEELKKREIATIREQGQREVEAERQRLLQASRDAAERLVAQAKTEIEAETKRAKASLREEAAGIAMAAAERLLGRSVNGDDQKRLAEQYVRDLGGKN